MSYEQILYDLKDRVLTITLNRPDKLNAYTPRMQDELKDAFHRADADDDVRAVVVTGAGRAFCAGADLSSGGGTFNYESRETTTAAGKQQSELATHRDGGGTLTLEIYKVRKPVIAAINGHAVGVGITMTLPMDIRIASNKAKIGFVFSRRGIVPEACSSYFLPRIVGISQAAEWCYTGRVFGAAEAFQGRLVSRLVEPDEVVPTAMGIAREIADNTSAVSVALAKQLLWSGLSFDHPMEAHRMDSKGIFWMGKSPDAAEGVSSFLEKRAPEFPMKPSTDMPPFYPWIEEPPFIP